MTWLFVRWEGSPENPSVKLSKPYHCSFNDEMINEINVLNIIITILALQAAELVCQTNEDEKNENEEGRESQCCCLNLGTRSGMTLTCEIVDFLVWVSSSHSE